MFDDKQEGESSTRIPCIRWNENLKVGDEVFWWADTHGYGLPAGHPDARERAGVIDHVDTDRRYPPRVIAYGVTCNGLSGPYQLTLRPDYHHEPRRVDQAQA